MKKARESKNPKLKKLLLLTLSVCLVFSTAGIAQADTGTVTANGTGSTECQAQLVTSTAGSADASPNTDATQIEHDDCYEPRECVCVETVAIPAERGKYYSNGTDTINNLLSTTNNDDAQTTTESRYGRQYLLDQQAAATAAAEAATDEELKTQKTAEAASYARTLEAYDRIVESISENPHGVVAIYKEGETLSILSDEGDHAYTLVIEDYPEFFWFDTGYTLNQRYYKNDPKTFYIDNIEPTYIFDTETAMANARATLDAKITDILTEMEEEIGETASDYDKELWLHNYIAENCVYDLNAPYAHSAYGMLVEGKAVCEGYTRAFQLLLNKLGIESTTITGSDDLTATTSNHIWNAVKINDDWYQVDITWDDQGDGGMDISYSYFNITNELMSKDHKVIASEKNAQAPTCTATTYWYFNQNLRNLVSIESYMKPVDNIGTLGWTIAELINDYGYARLYVSDYPELLESLYMSDNDNDGDDELWTLGEAVNDHMYIDGAYYYGYITYGPQNDEHEVILYMYPDEEDGEIVAADVWNYFYQDNAVNDVVVRAYPEGTEYADILSLIKFDMGENAGTDNKALYQAIVNKVEMDDVSELNYSGFVFIGIPLGTYEIAVYKPGRPLQWMELTIEEGGVSIARAFTESNWMWYMNSFGDVNDNWQVDLADAILMSRYLAGWGDAYNKIDIMTGDITGDDKINSADIDIFEKYIAECDGYGDLSIFCKPA